MSFTDNFTDTAGTDLADHTPSGGTSWTRTGTTGGATIQSNALAVSNADAARIYVCDDQGSASQYAIFRAKAFTTQVSNSFVACRLQDVDNLAAGWRITGTGAQGRKFSKVVAGIITNLITSQPVDEEWIKIEADGTTVRIYEGGTGASPGTWNQIGTDQTVTNFSTETSQGVRVQDSYGAAWIDDIEFGALGAAATSYVARRYSFAHMLVR